MYIPLKQASEKLNISSAALVVSAKYVDFYRKADTNKKNAMFDIDGYLKKNALMTELVEKTKLFTEYLNKIEKVSYLEIAKISGASSQIISECAFGYKQALTICVMFRAKRQKEWIGFHDYYGYSLERKKSR